MGKKKRAKKNLRAASSSPGKPKKNTHPHKICVVCKKNVEEFMPLQLVRDSVLELVKERLPDIDDKGFICITDLNVFRAELVEDALEKERGELTQLDHDVLKSLRKHDILSRNIDKEFDTKLTLGQQMADKVATFGGSWTFILSFGGFLVVWIFVNAFVLVYRPFDPYPFILLNLVLSCLAALQAPIIMMSQNRQDAKDRLRSEQDYRVNLKSELMIRHLNQKIDQLLSNQWQRLLNIQQVQVDLIEEALKKKRRR